MTVCIRCHRPLKAPTATGMGPVCARAARAQEPVAHERDLFGYDTEKAAQAALERMAIFVEVSAANAHMAVRRQFADARVRLLGWAT